jgi:predicted O-linked N-acetylglucosamine transferase (SPINDLY family)
MGVPVVSLIGDRHASRVGLSLLTAVNHSDWAAETPEAYIEKATLLANDRPSREVLRKTLRADFTASILCDHEGQASRFESALRYSWRKWCEQQA